MELTTKLTQLLKIDYPIISAPMAGISGGVLAGAVSKAGGLGMIGVGYSDVAWLEQQLEITRDVDIGIGFITWQLIQSPELLKIALAKRPRVIMLSFGDPTAFVEPIKASGAKLICQVQTVRDAKQAVASGADIIVAQGCEAGGHVGSRGTFVLVPAVVDAVAPIPVVAAGGIADGRGLAAALMLGAAGVLIGTRFYACTESLGHQNAKQLIVSASGDQTINSTIFDRARGLDWPTPFTARSLQNQFNAEYSRSTDSINAAARSRYQAALKENDFSIAAVFAGEAVDLIHDILPAEQIIKNIMAEAKRAMTNI